jgi:REP-associated tyrosine transposase
MARQPRNQLGDGIFHVTSRGVAKRTIFYDPSDFRLCICLLRDAAALFAWRLHVWCLMPNHYHLVVETLQPALSDGMHRLNGRYAQAFNQRYDRVGHLFQNRFGAWLVESEDHLENTCNYVLENPVRAGLVERADQWPWRGVG